MLIPKRKLFPNQNSFDNNAVSRASGCLLMCRARKGASSLSTRSPNIVWDQIRKWRLLPNNNVQAHTPFHADQSSLWGYIMLCYQASHSLLAVIGKVVASDARCGSPLENGRHGGAFVGPRVANVTHTFCTSRQICKCAVGELRHQDGSCKIVPSETRLESCAALVLYHGPATRRSTCSDSTVRRPLTPAAQLRQQ